MEDHKKFLRTTLFSEKAIISYRLLSRKLKVHVNQAKQMLYDFHATENARKPNCVHATYVVTGFRKPPPPIKGDEGSDEEGKDTEMQCSPFDSSLPATQATVTGEEEKKKKGELIRVIELCQEEDLDVAKTEFEKVLSIHVYSLAPVPLKDLSTLTGSSAEVLEISQREDVLKMGTTYGTILNPNAKRTSGRAPPPAPKKSTLAVQERKKEIIPAKEIKPEMKDTKMKEEAKGDEKGKKPAATAPTIPAKKPAPSAAAKPKRGQSNLFASWGNAPKKSAESASGPNSAVQSPKAEEEPDVKMESDDDDEVIEEEPSQPARDNAEDVKKRKERDDELRRMMEDEDEDEDVKMEDDEPPAKAAKIEVSPEIEEPSGSTANITTASGRRRGRRKVMKKVQSRDDEGYLVTKTEAVWESFSEDEPPPKQKPKAAAKGKKSAPTGQGNIMSFFAKK